MGYLLPIVGYIGPAHLRVCCRRAMRNRKSPIAEPEFAFRVAFFHPSLLLLLSKLERMFSREPRRFGNWIRGFFICRDRSFGRLINLHFRITKRCLFQTILRYTQRANDNSSPAADFVYVFTENMSLGVFLYAKELLTPRTTMRDTSIKQVRAKENVFT